MSVYLRTFVIRLRRMQVDILLTWGCFAINYVTCGPLIKGMQTACKHCSYLILSYLVQHVQDPTQINDYGQVNWFSWVVLGSECFFRRGFQLNDKHNE